MADHKWRERNHAIDPEAKRIAFAAARAAEHAVRELALLRRATEASEDAVARALEWDADTAYLDFTAIAKEHDLDR